MNKIAATFASLLLALFCFMPATVSAQNTIFKNVCSDSANSSSPVCKDEKSQQNSDSNSFYGANGILMKATNIVTIVVGIASVIMIIVGGIKYATSSGDSGNVNSAKNTILYAIIGLIIAMVARSIVGFVIGRL